MTVNLVTGADGFVGQHLVARLLGAGESVVGGVRRTPPQLTTLSWEEASRVRWIDFDLLDRNTIRELLRSSRPDRVFHLAAQSSRARSHEDPVGTFEVNAVGTLFLLEEIVAMRREAEGPSRVLVTGSAHVYGSAAGRCRPVSEDCPLEPDNLYGVSKVAQEKLAIVYQRSHGLPIVVTRSFHHTGPGQLRPFVVPELAARVRDVVARGGRGSVVVADAGIRRDFTDVRDVVRAYMLLADRGEIGQVYNVCSGRSYAIGELLEMLAGIAGVEVAVEADPQRSERAEVPEVVGSYRRLAEATGWTPQIEIRRSLADFLSGLEPA